jgi:hypothetical protein
MMSAHSCLTALQLVGLSPGRDGLTAMSPFFRLKASNGKARMKYLLGSIA